MSDVVGDGPRRLVTERREARPVVDVDEHGAIGLGERDVAPEHLEPQDRRRFERQRLQPILVDLGPLARQPRVRAVPTEEAPVGHPVELHDRAGHVLLQRDPGDAARRERVQLVRDALARGRHDVFGTLGVHVAPLDPHLAIVRVKGVDLLRRQRRRAGEDERARERQGAVPEPLHQPVAVTVERARRAVDDHRSIALQRHQLLRGERPLTHVQVQRRDRQPSLLDLALAGLDGVPPAPGELRDGGVQDRGVVHPMLHRRIRRAAINRDQLRQGGLAPRGPDSGLARGQPRVGSLQI